MVSELVLASAWRSERVLAWVRAVFSVVVLVRSLLVTSPNAARMAIGIPALFVTLGFSLWVLARGLRRPAPAFFMASIALDAAICFIALLPMALWPELSRVPLLDKADISAVLLAVASSAFRNSASLSVASCLLNTASFLLLMHWDRAAPWTSFEWHVALLYLVFLAASGGMASLLAQRARNLVTLSAKAALEIERAQRNLALVLREHHDLRSQLASATLNADLAQREVALARTPALEPLLDRIRLSLKQVNRVVTAIKERSYDELVRLEESRPADLETAAAAVRQELARRFPEARLELRVSSRALQPRIAGGSDGLRRLLLNLATNACEGSGARAASTVVIESSSTGSGELSIAVQDDGPGFASLLLDADGRVRLSSKPDGFGLGLSLVRQIVEHSGGSVRFGNGEQGGARVEIVVPAERAPLSQHAHPRSALREE